MLAHLRPWTTAHRRVISLLAAVAAASTLTIANPAQAQAPPYTCPAESGDTIELTDGFASATIYVSRNCSDGRSRFDGVVRDISGDGRAAFLRLDFLDNNGFVYRREEPSAINGFGSEASFAFNSGDPSPGMHVCVEARDWFSQSERECVQF